MDLSREQVFDSDDDLFDSLPDEIVLSIFKKLHDAKSLCLSMAACKRFRSIAPQVDLVFLNIPRKRSVVLKQIQKGFFKNLIAKALIKPLHFISHVIRSKSKNEEESDSDLHSFYRPNEFINSFQEIRALHLNLPCHENEKPGSKTSKNDINHPPTFLRWKADYGKELHSCVILGAKSLTENREKGREKSSPESRLISDDELKLRIVWTISCLIAASARHYLIQETVKERKMIESVKISDESGQGTVCMNGKQIEELREMKGEDASKLFEFRSLSVKMWYLEKLELSDSRKVMEGATLVVIRPGAGSAAEDGDLVAAAFCDEVEEEAVRKLMVAKKCYTLEMNSF